jgi:EpsI family protein
MGRRMILLGILFFCGWLFIARASKMEPVPIAQPLAEFPLQMEGWRGFAQAPFAADILTNLGVDDYLNRTYYSADGSGIVDFYVGYYQYQRQGKAIHSPLNCLPGAGWNPVKKDYLSISLPGTYSRDNGQMQRNTSDSVSVNRVVIAKGLDQQVVIYWYQSHGRVIASEYAGRIYSVLDAIRTRRTDAALVRIMSQAGGRKSEAEEKAEKLAVNFAKAIFQELNRFLPR